MLGIVIGDQCVARFLEFITGHGILGWMMAEREDQRMWCQDGAMTWSACGSDQLGVGIVETLLDLGELRRGQVDEVNTICHPLEPDIPDRYQVGITRMLVHDLLEDHLRLVLGVDNFHGGILGRKVIEPEGQRRRCQASHRWSIAAMS